MPQGVGYEEWREVDLKISVNQNQLGALAFATLVTRRLIPGTPDH